MHFIKKKDEGKEALERVSIGLSKLKTSLMTTETEYQLRSAGLKEFLDFTNRPAECIFQLYYRIGEEALRSRGEIYLLLDICLILV